MKINHIFEKIACVVFIIPNIRMKKKLLSLVLITNEDITWQISRDYICEFAIHTRASLTDVTIKISDGRIAVINMEIIFFRESWPVVECDVVVVFSGRNFSEYTGKIAHEV